MFGKNKRIEKLEIKIFEQQSYITWLQDKCDGLVLNNKKLRVELKACYDQLGIIEEEREFHND